MSRTKCALSGPVAATPGTRSYQADGATSMKVPFAASATPSTTAIEIADTTVSCVSLKDETARPDVTCGGNFFRRRRTHSERQPGADAGYVGRVRRNRARSELCRLCGVMRAPVAVVYSQTKAGGM